MSWYARRCVPIAVVALLLGALDGCSRTDPREVREPPKDDETQVARTVPSGTSLVFSVDRVVSTATHARGDVFSATLRNRVSDTEGGEAIPEGVPSQWIVTEASTENGATVLAIRLESIRVNGSWTPVVADVTEAELRPSSADPATAADPAVAIGPAATEVLVEILGEDSVPPGADVGTMVTLTTKGHSATLPAGSAITVQLAEPLDI
jgi:hypothetical protein